VYRRARELTRLQDKADRGPALAKVILSEVSSVRRAFLAVDHG
jgi:hypothetical protein